MIKIAGLNKAEVLAALYNRAQPQGMGHIIASIRYTPDPMSTEQAQEIIDDGHTYFDYLKGRVMKVDLRGDELNPAGYDRDNGPGAALGALTDAGLIAV